MRKIFILFLSLCLTGCIVSNDDFEKTCSVVMSTSNLKEKTDIQVVYDNEDNINSAVYIKRYEALGEKGLELLKEIKESGTLFNEKYAFNDNIKITVSLDEENVWEIKYYLNVQRLSDNILDEFSLKKNSIKFFNKMKKENIECE